MIDIQKRLYDRISPASIFHTPEFDFGIGNPLQDNILIIGEQVGKPDRDPDFPFFSDQGSSGWLNRQLDEANISEHWLFWMNALDRQGNKKDLSALVEMMQPSYVIALGKVAESLCNEHGIPHIAIPHPQFWRRFKSKERYPLLDYIIECNYEVVTDKLRGRNGY